MVDKNTEQLRNEEGENIRRNNSGIFTAPAAIHKLLKSATGHFLPTIGQ
jgi:hypothetical protein